MVYVIDKSCLLEMKTKEEYGKRSFKKKYDFTQLDDYPNSGSITVDGDVCMVDLDGKDVGAYIAKAYPRVSLNKDFFKLKGSNKNERRDAVLQHEIGHTKLHNINPNYEEIDPRNRSTKVVKHHMTKLVHNDSRVPEHKKIENLSHEDRKTEYDESGLKKHAEMNPDPKYLKERNKAFAAALKYENPKVDHIAAEEFEADRYAANRTSPKAVKRSLRNFNKINHAESKRFSKANGVAVKFSGSNEDYKVRSKALKDKDLINSEVYKR